MPDSRIADLNTFYRHLSCLEHKVGADCRLEDCVGSELGGKSGVYFFFERGENRSEERSRQRVVHVGNSDDLRRRFTAEIKGGNESAAALRRHIVKAVSRRGPGPVSESERKSLVSNHLLSEMRLLYVFVPSETMEDIKINSVALLSACNGGSTDLPSPGWLGRCIEPEESPIRRSGLWHCHYVKRSYNPGFLAILEDCIRRM